MKLMFDMPKIITVVSFRRKFNVKFSVTTEKNLSWGVFVGGKRDGKGDFCLGVYVLEPLWKLDKFCHMLLAKQIIRLKVNQWKQWVNLHLEVVRREALRSFVPDGIGLHRAGQIPD